MLQIYSSNWCLAVPTHRVMWWATTTIFHLHAILIPTSKPKNTKKSWWQVFSDSWWAQFCPKWLWTPALIHNEEISIQKYGDLFACPNTQKTSDHFYQLFLGRLWPKGLTPSLTLFLIVLRFNSLLKPLRNWKFSRKRRKRQIYSFRFWLHPIFTRWSRA